MKTSQEIEVPSQLSRSGTEVLIVNTRHPRHGALGVIAGRADTLGDPRIRILVDGEFYLCDPSDLTEN